MGEQHCLVFSERSDTGKESLHKIPGYSGLSVESNL